MPTFGVERAGLAYRPRPSVYGLACNTEGEVALVRETSGWYLPGGGIEAGESPEQALLREIKEECACRGEIHSFLGEAIEFIVSLSGTPLRIEARFYQVHLAQEADVVWCPRAEAAERLVRASQAWLIRTQLLACRGTGTE